MAGAVFGSVGAKLGGLAGGTFGWTQATWSQLGWTAGVLVGNYLFASGPDTEIEGPRLDDLKVTSSAYGTPIPKVFGFYRISGNIIWALPIAETKHEEREESGKGGGGGSSTSTWYTYSGTWAVSLCEGPITGIRKIWFGSKLVYNVSDDGDYNTFSQSGKLGSQITFHDGSADQSVDWLIESNDPDSPAYRHVATLVFSGIQLKEYGDIIPNVTCEVVKSGSTASKLVTNSFDYIDQNIDSIGVITNFIGNYVYTFVPLWDNSFRNQNFNVYKSIDSASKATPYKNITISTENDNNLRWDNNISGIPTEEIRVIPRVFTNIPAFVLYWNDGTYYHLYIYNEEGGINPHYDSPYLDPVNEDAIYPGGNGFYFNQNTYDFSINYTTAFIKDYNNIFITRNHTGCYILRAINNAFVDVIESSLLTNVYETFVGDAEIYTLDKTSGDLRNVVVKVYNFDGNLLNTISQDTDGDVWRDQTSENFFSRLFSSEDGQLYIIAPPYMDLHLINTNTGDYTFFENTLSDNDVITWGNAYGGYTVKNDIYHQHVRSYGDPAIDKNQILTYNAFDPNGILIGDIIQELELESGLLGTDIDNTNGDDVVYGYVIPNNMTARVAVEPLLSAYEYSLIETDHKILLRKLNQPSIITIPEENLGANTENPIEYNIKQDLDLFKSLTVRYANSDSDYQNSAQSVMRIDVNATEEKVVELPMALTDDQAKQIAERNIYKNWLYRKSVSFSISFQYRALILGDVITIIENNISIDVRLTSITITEDNILQCVALVENQSVYESTSEGADTGNNGGLIVGEIGDTAFIVLDVPTLDNTFISNEGLYVAASEIFSGWRGANLLTKSSASADLTAFSTVVGSAGIGIAQSILDSGKTEVWDRVNTVTVSSTVTLEELAEENVVSNGTNYILIGSEVLQYASAIDNGNSTYTLSNLLRGRRGTEWAVDSHVSGEPFVQLNRSGFSFANKSINSNDYFAAISLGLTEPSDIVQKLNTGVNLKPLSPWYVKYERQNINDIYIEWMRRSRYISGYFKTLPMVEQEEKYNIDVYYKGASLINHNTLVPSFTYTEAMQTADGIEAGDRVELYISQVSAVYGNGETSYLDVISLNILKANLISYFKLDESPNTNGTLFTEEIAGLDATLSSSTNSYSGQPAIVTTGGYSLYFNYNQNRILHGQADDIYSISKTGELGISMYLNVNSLFTNNNCFISKRNSSGSYEWEIVCSTGSTIQVAIYRNTSTETDVKRIQLDNGMPQNVNKHLVVNFIGNTFNGDIQVYLDGVEMPYTVLTAPNSYISDSSSCKLSIGGYEGMSSGDAISGTIDDVRIYNKAITPDQIAALNALKVP